MKYSPKAIFFIVITITMLISVNLVFKKSYRLSPDYARYVLKYTTPSYYWSLVEVDFKYRCELTGRNGEQCFYYWENKLSLPEDKGCALK
jgi:hypothetical protein